MRSLQVAGHAAPPPHATAGAGPPREGAPGAPHAHRVLATIPVAARETDGLDVTNTPLSPAFPEGMLVLMSTDKTVHCYDWRDVRKRLPPN